MEVSGKVKVLMDTQTFASGFEKREFVITTQEQYPQDVKFECIKDKIAMLDSLQPGMDVTVAFNLRGNEYQGKYFVNLQAWKVTAGVAATQGDAGAPMPASAPVAAADADDDLPF